METYKKELIYITRVNLYKLNDKIKKKEIAK
jgi:hypothetical protein